MKSKIKKYKLKQEIINEINKVYGMGMVNDFKIIEVKNDRIKIEENTLFGEYAFTYIEDDRFIKGLANENDENNKDIYPLLKEYYELTK